MKILFLLFALTLTGCASTMSGGPVTPTMSDESFVKATPEARQTYLNNIREENVLLTAKKDVEYMTGRPVYYGQPSDGFTLQWVKRLELVSICKGHTTGFTGIDSSLCAVAMADENGNVGMQTVGGVKKPTVLLTSVSNQEGLGRIFIKGGFQVLSAGVNGALASKIASDGSCGANCGNINMINTGGNALAGASSDAQSGAVVDVNAVLGTCPSGDCVPVWTGAK